MSAPEGTRATVLLADYISSDQSGKLTAVGAGFTITGIQQTGATAPQYVGAIIDVPPRFAGTNLGVTLELRDETVDAVATAPGPSGQLEAIRVQQLMPVQRPSVPGLAIPEEVTCRVQTVLGFPVGLPLIVGHRYAWKLEIDGTRYRSWSAHFYVAGPPEPIVGGVAAAPNIPEIEMPSDLDEEPEA